MKRMLVVILMGLCLVGCSPDTSAIGNRDSSLKTFQSGVSRFVDYNGRVVCYMYGEAIDCIPFPDLSTQSDLEK